MELVDKEAFKVVGVVVEADWQGLWEEMPRAWQQFVARQGEIRQRVGERFMDISLEEKEGRYKQLICAQVSDFENVPQGMVAMEIPEQRYLYQRHLGPVEEIAYTFERMYDWAKQNGVPLGNFRIDSGYTTEGEEEEHDLFVRVEE